jgi:hypothetical protein
MTTTPTTIVGMFFLRDGGEYYVTGEILAEVKDGFYLMKPDNMNGIPVSSPLEVVQIEDMTLMNDYGIPAISLFSTREALDAWIAWIDTPSKPRVLNLVKPPN